MGLKKYTKSYDVTKQLAKEKFGKASNSVDNDHTKYTKERLHLIKWLLKHNKAAGFDYVHSHDALADKEQAFGDVLAAMGDPGTIDASIGDAFGVLGTTTKENIVAMRAHSRCTVENILTPLSQLYENDAKKVLEVKKKQEIARLRYESAQAKVKEHQKKGGKKLQEAEQELQQSKVNYESLTQDMEFTCDVLIQKMDERLLPLAQTYAQAQAEYYAKLAEHWRTAQERVAKIATTPHEPTRRARTPPVQHDEPTPYDTPAPTTHKHEPVAETYQDGNPFENTPQPQPSQYSSQSTSQPPSSQPKYQPPPLPEYPSLIMNSQSHSAPNLSQLPPQPSMQDFSHYTPNKTTTNSKVPNYYPEENDPFQQKVGADDPFAQRPKNVYSH